MKTKVIIMFGGDSPEREVSVITGLQVIEQIDKKIFDVYSIELARDGIFYFYPGLRDRKGYYKIKPHRIQFCKDKSGPYFHKDGIFSKKKYIDVVYLAFHGGKGESGQLQGFLETLDIAYTSASVEASVISMNKVLTKEVLERHGLKTIPWVRVFSRDIKNNIISTADYVEKSLGFPVIVKPVHLGSSIAINIARTRTELKKFLLEASYVDSEILIEKYVKKFREYNVSVRKMGDTVVVSEIERPISQDEILSFADKYEKGGKKLGGMSSLSRELPAKITERLKKNIHNTATEVYRDVRCKGLVRIDFMITGRSLYVIEINPIPGSMSFYLWESSGQSFKDVISQEIRESIEDKKAKDTLNFKYNSDIVRNFIRQKIN